MIEKIGFISKLFVLMIASVFTGIPEKKEIPVDSYEQRRIEFNADKLTEDSSNEKEIYTTVVEQADILVDAGSRASKPSVTNKEQNQNKDDLKKAGSENNKDEQKTEKSEKKSAETKTEDAENKSFETEAKKADKKTVEEKAEKADKNKIEEKTVNDFSRLAPTVNMSFEELVGDNLDRSLPSYMPEPGTYKLIVDLKYQVVMAYKKDESGKYNVPVRYMLCSTGADSTPTPTGTFKMRDYRVRYGLFVNTESYAQYWSLITGRIYFHSVLYLDTDASQYTETSYNNLGHNVSHGCIRLTVPDARWIWYNCAPGTEITIRQGSSKDTDTKDIREKLVLAKLPDKRVDFKKIELPYTDNWKLEDVPAEFKFINGSQ